MLPKHIQTFLMYIVQVFHDEITVKNSYRVLNFATVLFKIRLLSSQNNNLMFETF